MVLWLRAREAHHPPNASPLQIYRGSRTQCARAACGITWHQKLSRSVAIESPGGCVRVSAAGHPAQRGTCLGGGVEAEQIVRHDADNRAEHHPCYPAPAHVSPSARTRPTRRPHPWQDARRQSAACRQSANYETPSGAALRRTKTLCITNGFLTQTYPQDQTDLNCVVEKWRRVVSGKADVKHGIPPPRTALWVLACVR